MSCARTKTETSGGLQSKLADVHSTPNETADTISTCIKNSLDKHHLFQKCMAYAGDNCNTNFGDVRRKADGNNVFAKLQMMKSNANLAPLVGIGYPAYVLNNAAHHGADTLDLDIECPFLSFLWKGQKKFNITPNFNFP